MGFKESQVNNIKLAEIELFHVVMLFQCLLESPSDDRILTELVTHVDDLSSLVNSMWNIAMETPSKDRDDR